MYLKISTWYLMLLVLFTYIYSRMLLLHDELHMNNGCFTYHHLPRGGSWTKRLELFTCNLFTNDVKGRQWKTERKVRETATLWEFSGLEVGRYAPFLRTNRLWRRSLWHVDLRGSLCLQWLVLFELSCVSVLCWPKLACVGYRLSLPEPLVVATFWPFGILLITWTEATVL